MTEFISPLFGANLLSIVSARCKEETSECCAGNGEGHISSFILLD
jgi:hypothetical protein